MLGPLINLSWDLFKKRSDIKCQNMNKIQVCIFATSRDLTDQGIPRPIFIISIFITSSHLFLSSTRLTTQKETPGVNTGPLRCKRAPNWIEREEG